MGKTGLTAFLERRAEEVSRHFGRVAAGEAKHYPLFRRLLGLTPIRREISIARKLFDRFHGEVLERIQEEAPGRVAEPVRSIHQVLWILHRNLFWDRHANQGALITVEFPSASTYHPLYPGKPPAMPSEGMTGEILQVLASTAASDPGETNRNLALQQLWRE